MIKVVTGKFADVSHRLRAVRSYHKLGSEAFAVRAGVNVKSYSQWENGEIRISVDGAIKLRDEYKLTLDFIYVGDDDHLPHALANHVEKVLEWLDEQATQETQL